MCDSDDTLSYVLGATPSTGSTESEQSNPGAVCVTTGAALNGEIALASYVEPDMQEWLVISGGAYDTSPDHFQYPFIETALKKINELCEKRNGDDKILINWIIADAGWADDDKKKFGEAINRLPVNIIFLDSVTTLLDYINFGKDRKVVQITRITVFSHGTLRTNDIPGPAISLGYNQDNWKVLHFVRDYLSSHYIYTEPCRSPFCEFYSCNTGTDGAYSWAQTWVNLVGGETWAFIGKSDYAGINVLSFLELDQVWAQIRHSRKLHGFSYLGSYWYPVGGYQANGQKSEWTSFSRMEGSDG
jgi:hypothetical protein